MEKQIGRYLGATIIHKDENGFYALKDKPTFIDEGRKFKNLLTTGATCTISNLKKGVEKDIFDIVPLDGASIEHFQDGDVLLLVGGYDGECDE